MEPQAKINVFWRYPSRPDVSLNFVFSVSEVFDNNNKNCEKTEKKSILPFQIAWPSAAYDVIGGLRTKDWSLVVHGTRGKV